MKICLINKSYMKKAWDGISTYTHYLAQGLSEYGHEVHIITGDTKDKSKHNKKENKVWVHKIELNEKFGKFSELLYGLRVYFKFKEIDKKYGIDIVEAPEAGAEGFWLSIFARRKLITRLHTPLFLYWKFGDFKLNWSRRVLNFMEKTQAKRSTLLSCPTKSLTQIVSKIWKIPKDKIEILPSPVIIKKSKKQNISEVKNYILCLGRVEKIQGVDILIRALKIVLKKYPNLKIACVGGIDKEYYNRHLKNMCPGMKQKNIIFSGEVEHNKVFDYIKRARLIVLPVLWENFPYKLLEAMGLGKVVIATNRGGFKEIIKNEQNGFLTKPDSHINLAKKIIECLELDEKKIKSIKKEALKTVSKYSIPQIIPETVTFYAKAKLISEYLYNAKKELNWSKKVPKEQLQTLLRPGGLWGEGQEIENKGRQKIREFIQELIENKKRKISVLDVGCGTGIDYEGFKKYKLKIDYTGLEAVSTILNSTKTRYPKGNFLLGDAENLPFPNNSFDVVFARHVLEHLPGYKKAISELFRVARHVIILDFFITPTYKPNHIKMHYFKIPSEKFCWVKAYQNHYNKKELLHYLNIFNPKKVEIFENLTKDNKYFDTIYKITKNN